jgi:hypothetical protein
MATQTQTTASQHLTIVAEPHDVETEILYTKEADDEAVTIEAIHRQEPKFRDVHKGVVKDVRPHVEDFTLEKHGFQYVHHSVPQDHFANDDAIKTIHYPEMEEFLAKT